MSDQAYQKVYHQQQWVKDHKKQAKQKVQAEVAAYKESHPCMDCGQFFPHYVMDFDHRDRSQKKENVSIYARRGATKAVWAEIEKCDLVCANCHRARTFNYMRALVLED